MIRAFSLVQPAVVVHDLDAGVDRMHELFKAVPSEKNYRPDFSNAVYAFGNYTYLEVLDGVREGHTRARFLRQFGPGLYMLCTDLEDADPDDVERELARLGIRVVAPGRQTLNIQRGWHLHPQDAGSILVLHALKKDKTDNTDWAGLKADAYVPGNSRVAKQLLGVLARTANPAVEARRFSEIGFPMEDLGTSHAFGWTGPTGTILELWPEDAWQGGPVDERRDYALCFSVGDVGEAVRHFDQHGLGGEFNADGNRWISQIDPILGVRLAVQSKAGSSG